MITIVAMPKPFKGHINIIQRNAIKSWTLLKPSCEIILFGDEEGVESVAGEYGLTYVKNIKRNEFGTPLLSDLFDQAQKIAKNDTICFVNSDIVLMNDFINAVGRVVSSDLAARVKKFLLIGRRWNIDIKQPLDFSDSWEQKLRDNVKTNGKLHSNLGIDYFVFPRGLWGQIPDFAIGRPGYDNWLVFRARSLHIPVVDMTKAVMGVHQNHDYSHIKNRDDEFYRGPESKKNLSLVGGNKNLYNIYDADWVLTKKSLRHTYLNRLRRPLDIVLQPIRNPRYLLYIIIINIKKTLKMKV